MPQPYPGQDWKHGWIPVTAKAIRQKNHGRNPGPNSKLGKAMARGGNGGSDGRSSGNGSSSTRSAADSPSQQMDTAIRSRAARRRTRSATTTTTASAPPARSAAQPRTRNTVHRVIDSNGNTNYVSSPDPDRINRAASRQGMTTEPSQGSHEEALAKAPRQLRQVWEAAERNGWSAQYSPFKRSGGTLHRLTVQGPEGETYRMSWSGNRRNTYGDEPAAQNVIAAMDNPDNDMNREARRRARAEREYAEGQRQRRAEIERRSRMSSAERAAEDHQREQEARQERERQRLEEARRAEAERDAARRRQIELYEQAERNRAEVRRQVEEQMRREAEQRRQEQERQEREAAARKERAKELNSQAARAYRAGNHERALELLDRAIEADPTRAAEFSRRQDTVRRAMNERQTA